MPIRTDFPKISKTARCKSGQIWENFWNGQVKYPDRNSVSKFSQVRNPDTYQPSWCTGSATLVRVAKSVSLSTVSVYFKFFRVSIFVCLDLYVYFIFNFMIINFLTSIWYWPLTSARQFRSVPNATAIFQTHQYQNITGNKQLQTAFKLSRKRGRNLDQVGWWCMMVPVTVKISEILSSQKLPIYHRRTSVATTFN